MGKKRYSEVVATPGFRVEETKNGHPQLVVPLKIVDCVDATRIGEVVTKFQVVMLDSDDSCKWAIELLRALGMTNGDILNPEGLGSIRASCTEEQETYEGKTAFKVKWINPVKVGIEGDKANAFAALLAAKFAQVPAVDVCDANRAPEVLPESKTASTGEAPDEEDFFK